MMNLASVPEQAPSIFLMMPTLTSAFSIFGIFRWRQAYGRDLCKKKYLDFCFPTSSCDLLKNTIAPARKRMQTLAIFKKLLRTSLNVNAAGLNPKSVGFLCGSIAHSSYISSFLPQARRRAEQAIKTYLSLACF